MKTFYRVATLILIALGNIAYAQGSPSLSITRAPSTVPIESQVITADTHYYIETTGNDSNNCTALATPCLTGNGAIKKIPKTSEAIATVTFGLGTFSGFTVEDLQLVGQFRANTTDAPKYIFEGTNKIATITGLSSGSVASFAAESGNTFATATVTAAGWTVDALIGKMFYVNGGTGSGRTYQIQSNTGTVVSLNDAVTAMDATSTFQILDSGTTLTCNQALFASVISPYASSFAGVSNYACIFARELRGSVPITSGDAYGYWFRNFNFSGGTQGVFLLDADGVTVGWNSFVSQTTAGISAFNTTGLRALRNSATMANNLYFLASGGSIPVTRGNGGLNFLDTIVVGGGLYSTIFGSVDAATISRVVSKSGNNSTGIIYMDGTVGLVQLTSVQINGNASASAPCLQFGGNSISGSSSLGGSLRFTGGVYSSCNWAWELFGPAVDVTCVGTSVTGTGNTRFGIYALNGVSVRASAPCAVTGNLGDLTFDNSTAIPYADVVTYGEYVDLSNRSSFRP